MKVNQLFLAVAVTSIFTLTINAAPMQVRSTLIKGCNFVANPFSSGSHNVNDVLPVDSGVPDGSVIECWDSATGEYQFGGTFIGGYGWVDADFNLSAATLPPYSGALVITPGNAEIVLTESPASAGLASMDAPKLEKGITLRSVPAGSTLEEACPKSKDGDTISAWNAAGQTYGDVLTYLDLGSVKGWFTTDFDMVDPVIAPGVSFFYQCAH